MPRTACSRSTGGDETITLSDITDVSGLEMRIDSTASESVDFALPTNSLTINAWHGIDTVQVTTVDTDYRRDAGDQRRCWNGLGEHLDPI
jgi:hypothetical protein